jgi:hypothetical protein
MSAHSRLGALCLVLAPLLGLASVVAGAPVSGKAADQATAYVEHPAAAHAGLALNALAAALLIGGVVWLASVCFERAPALAVTGGVLAVAGLLAVLFDDAVRVAGSLMVAGTTAADATTALRPLTTGGVFVVGPLSELGDVGLVVLTVAALRFGLPRWAAGVLCAGVIGEGLGFATGSRVVAAAGFGLTAAGLAAVVRTRLAAGRTVPPARPRPVASGVRG